MLEEERGRALALEGERGRALVFMEEKEVDEEGKERKILVETRRGGWSEEKTTDDRREEERGRGEKGIGQRTTNDEWTESEP